MKKIVILAIGIVAIVCNQAMAQEAGKFSVIGKLGYFSPADSDLKDDFGSGVCFSGGGKYTMSPQLAIVGAVDYWKGDKTIDGVDVTVKIMPLTVGVVYNLPVQGTAGVTPYIGGGLGNYSCEITADCSGISANESTSAIGFYILGGVDCPVSPTVSINAEAKFASAKSSDSYWDDMKLGGLTIGGGVAISF